MPGTALNSLRGYPISSPQQLYERGIIRVTADRRGSKGTRLVNVRATGNWKSQEDEQMRG